MAKPRVLLVFPPRWDCTSPYLSLPKLSAYLKAHGVAVKACDLNLEATRWLLGHEGTLQLGRALQSLASPAPDSRCDQSSRTATWTRMWGKTLKSDHARTIAILRDPARATLRDVHRAELVLQKAWDLVDALDAAHAVDSTVPLPHRQFLATRLDQLARWKPDIVGFSAPSREQFAAAVGMAAYLKDTRCTARMVAGGVAVTSAFSAGGSQAAIPGVFDTIVLWRGEEALLDLIAMARARTPWPRVYRGRRFPRDRSDPLPDFDAVPMRRYLQTKYNVDYPFSYGCTWRRCTYCGLNCTFKYDIPDPARSLDQVCDLQGRFDCRTFSNTGSALAASDAEAMARLILKRRMHVGWNTMARAEPDWTLPRCRLLKRSGLRYVEFGIESLSDTVLARMGKGISAAEQVTVLQAACTAGLKPTVFLMYGFPGERVSDVRHTMAKLSRFAGELSTVNMFRFHLDRGSIIAAKPENFGVRLLGGAMRSKTTTDIFRIPFSAKGQNRETRRALESVLDEWVYDIARRTSMLFHRSPNYNLFVFDLGFFYQSSRIGARMHEDYFVLDSILERKYRLNADQIRWIDQDGKTGYWLRSLLLHYRRGSQRAAIIRGLEKGMPVGEVFDRHGVSPRKDLRRYLRMIQTINGLDLVEAIIPV